MATAVQQTVVVNGVTLLLMIFTVTPRKRIFDRNKENYNKKYEGVTR